MRKRGGLEGQGNGLSEGAKTETVRIEKKGVGGGKDGKILVNVNVLLNVLVAACDLRVEKRP